MINSHDIPQKSAECKETRKKIAEMAGVSHDTIHKIETVDTKAPEPVKQAMEDYWKRQRNTRSYLIRIIPMFWKPVK